MQIETQEVNLEVDGAAMRVRVSAPVGTERFPGVVMYSEIFQLTAPIRRAMERLAGHGFVVAAPEIFHRLEPSGAVIPYDDDGRARGLRDAQRTHAAEHDADRVKVLDYLARHPRVASERLGAMGFCLGGHLALRAALDIRIHGVVACYPTGVHNGKLGAEADCGTLRELAKTNSELLIVFGERDPHVPLEGREHIARALEPLGARCRILAFPAEHAFMRDEGPRYDPAESDEVWRQAVTFLRFALANRAL